MASGASSVDAKQEVPAIVEDRHEASRSGEVIVMTGGEYLKSRLRDLLSEAEELATDEFDAEQMSRFVRDAAALFERFFKRMRLTRPPADPSLNNLINALEYEGLAAPERAKLHNVRTAANAAKHDPSRHVTYAEVAAILAGAVEAVDALAQEHIAEIIDQYEAQYRRRFLLALWDHLTTGESEIYVWPAVLVRLSETGVLVPGEMDSFQFRYADEEKAIQHLQVAGELRWEGVGEPTLSALQAVGDFARAGHWEGEYRDLVAACATAQHDLGLLPGLARADREGSVAASLAMSTVDLARARPSERLTKEDLLAHAASAYGIRRRSDATMYLAPAFERFVASIPDELCGSLTGPRCIGTGRFQAEAAHAAEADVALGVAVLPGGELIFELV